MKALRTLPIRFRLALISAGLTFVILMLFALLVGKFAADQVRDSFDDDLRRTAADLEQRLPLTQGGIAQFFSDESVEAASSGDAVIRLVSVDGQIYHASSEREEIGPPRQGIHDHTHFRVATRVLRDPAGQPVGFLQYAKPRDHIDSTIARIRFLLGLGVVGGAVLAFLFGLALARRAMAPIANLTQAAREIERTRNPAMELPQPEADDEVADLARTLESMLHALDASRRETEGALARQREFVADASHELRTPLTSILANLELLEASLHGDDAETAGAALRSSRRMRRLVGDLLLLARADAGREGLREHVALAEIAREAVAEATSVAADHRLVLDLPERGPVIDGVTDDLHRLTLNLVENALVHTPPGTPVTVRVGEAAGQAVLEVEDAGPGIPPDARERIFDRFVRGQGETGGGSGLGLAIVRAVAQRHGGSVEVGEGGAGGARFTVRLPVTGASPPPDAAARVHEPDAGSAPPPDPATRAG
ncbi:MAG TPA: HAMP domain-containing sensor histidine kinase [Thermoleophilaceae bacterium]|jgi:signal transduction histidine kinase